MKNKRFLLFAITIFLIIIPLTAKNSKKSAEEKDLKLSEIDKLIRRTEYEQALRQLNVYLENNPENFDNAYARISAIMKAREEYRQDFEELVKTFEKISLPENSENSSEIVELSTENTDEETYYAECNKIKDKLNSIEHNPPREIKQVLDRIDATISLNYMKPRAQKILRLSADFAHQNEYVKATKQLREGFDLFKVDYFIHWEDYPEIISETNGILASIENHLKIFETSDLSVRLESCVKAFNESVNQEDFVTAWENLKTVSDVFSEYSALRAGVYGDAEKISRLYEKEKEMNPEYGDTDASFLPFMLRFVKGSAEIEDSGICGVVTYQSEKLSALMNDCVFAKLEEFCSDFISVLKEEISAEDGDAKENSEIKNQIDEISKLQIAVIKTSENLKTDSEYEVMTPKFENQRLIAQSLPSLALLCDEIYVSKTQNDLIMKDQAGILAQFDSPSPFFDRNAAVKTLSDSALDMAVALGNKKQRELNAFDWAEKLKSGENPFVNELCDFYDESLNQTFEKSYVRLASVWKKITDYYKNQGDILVENILTQNEKSQKFYTGFYEKITSSVREEIESDISKAFSFANQIENDETKNFGIYYSYPDISKKMAEYSAGEIQKTENQINDYVNFIQNVYDSTENWKSDEEISKIVENSVAYLKNQIEELKTKSDVALKIAENSDKKINEAQTAWNNAEENYENAKSALKDEEFSIARANLETAGNFYTQSLGIQENQKKSDEAYEKLHKLREEITDAENEFVVREVRNHMNKAWSDFYAGRYDDAQRELSEAEERWKTTNTTENLEVKKLFSYVNKALLSQSGFEILPSDPLYTEMSQRLSTANQFYDSGSKKYELGDTEGGIEDFTAAENKLNEVKIVYPLNLTASILSLKIEKILRPQEFSSNLKTKIEEAVNQCKSKDSDVQEKGYAYLKAYAELEPDYPELNQKIVQAEIDMGKRPAPVDNSAKTRAQTLFVQARRTFNSAGENENQLQRALNLIEQAIDLDSSLKDAAALKDRILIKMGGSSSPDFTPSDQILFNQAVVALDDGYVVRAKRIMDALLKSNSRYTENPDFMELYQEIQNR
jgi:hypothetical protein